MGVSKAQLGFITDRLAARRKPCKKRDDARKGTQNARTAKLKPKRCKECKTFFTPTRPLAMVCSVNCSIKYGRRMDEKRKDREWSIRKKILQEKTKTHKDYLKELQTVFNAFIRERDAARSCVSCGATQVEEWHAGHFIATTYQFLRFHEDNCWRQCSKCNTHLRGNPIPYRIELLKRIGKERVEYLENQRHNTLKLSIPEIKEKISYYKEKVKEFKK